MEEKKSKFALDLQSDMGKHYKIRKGLDIKLLGEAKPIISEIKETRFALLPDDFKWVTPKLLLSEGDSVSVGTPVFCSKSNPQLHIVSPVSGHIVQIVRGEKHKLEAIIIDSDDLFTQTSFDIPKPLDSQSISSLLLQTGLWSFIRQRPFGIIADPTTLPKSIFISCFDSAPLAPDYAFILKDKVECLQTGINILSLLAQCPIQLCINDQSSPSIFSKLQGVDISIFEGPHPAGNVGTQIHHIDPILSKKEIIWFIEPQHLAMIGHFFLNHTLDFSKIIAVTGSCALNPSYQKVTCGSALQSQVKHQLTNTNHRIISGNVLTGKTRNEDGFLGYYDQQITLIEESEQRELFGWLYPGFSRWSFSHSYLSWMFKSKKFNINTMLHGGIRTLMITNIYDKVFPFDIMPLELVKACIIQDIELMEDLGIYEVIGEDMALCEVICPSKVEWQTIIEKGEELVYNN